MTALRIFVAKLDLYQSCFFSQREALRKFKRTPQSDLRIFLRALQAMYCTIPAAHLSNPIAG